MVSLPSSNMFPVTHLPSAAFPTAVLKDHGFSRLGSVLISSDEFTQSLTCILRQFYDYIKVLDDAMYSSCSLHLDAIDFYPIAFGYNNNSRTS